MRSKVRKTNFTFNFPLIHKVVKDLKIVDENIGSLQVFATGYFRPEVSPIDVDDRYNVDIDYIKWNGADITPVVEHFGFTDDIAEAAIRHFAELVNESIAA